MGDVYMTQKIKRLGLRVPINLYGKVKDKADLQGKTINALCLEMFWLFFDTLEDRERKPPEAQGTAIAGQQAQS